MLLYILAVEHVRQNLHCLQLVIGSVIGEHTKAAAHAPVHCSLTHVEGLY